MGRFVPDAEIQTIYYILSHRVQSYEQVIEVSILSVNVRLDAELFSQLLSHLPLHSGGLLPLAFGLFHPIPTVRDQTVDLFTTIRSYKVRVLIPSIFDTDVQLSNLDLLLDWAALPSSAESLSSHGVCSIGIYSRNYIWPESHCECFRHHERPRKSWSTSSLDQPILFKLELNVARRGFIGSSSPFRSSFVLFVSCSHGRFVVFGSRSQQKSL